MCPFTLFMNDLHLYCLAVRTFALGKRASGVSGISVTICDDQSYGLNVRQSMDQSRTDSNYMQTNNPTIANRSGRNRKM
jgi:hypothetical protein